MTNPGGRPLIPIDWKKVDQLLMAGCLGTEIAAFFAMVPNTFYERVENEYGMKFTQFRQEKLAKGDALLRAKQYEKALAGDNTNLIWLGKQRLGQREPEPLQQVSKNDAAIDLSLKIIKDPENQVKAEEVNGAKQETALQHTASGCAIQHMDRSGTVGEDICEPI